jgi:hypothetical protein
MAETSGTGPYERAQGLFSDAGQAAERLSYGAVQGSLTFPFVTRGGRALSVTLAEQPVFDLGRSVQAGRRLRRILRHSGGQSALGALSSRSLATADLKRIDLQTMVQGLELMKPVAGEAIVLPAFWRTAATSPGRFALRYTAEQLDGRRGALMIEVLGGPDTAPTQDLADSITHFETRALGVILHIAPDIALARRLVEVGADCLAIDFAGVDHDGPASWAAAEALIAAARASAPRLLLLNLRPEWARAAAAAGATHAVFAPMAARTV